MRLRAVLALALSATALGACAGQGFVFRRDERVSVVRPADREEVRAPVTVTWRVDKALAADIADPSRGAAGFAVVLDQAPQPVGQSIAWFARGDDGCVKSAHCPDLAYLAERRVFTTRATSMTFNTIGDSPFSNAHRHEVTIFLIDNRGHRLSESAWTVEFRTPKDAD